MEREGDGRHDRLGVSQRGQVDEDRSRGRTGLSAPRPTWSASASFPCRRGPDEGQQPWLGPHQEGSAMASSSRSRPISGLTGTGRLFRGEEEAIAGLSPDLGSSPWRMRRRSPSVCDSCFGAELLAEDRCASFELREGLSAMSGQEVQPHQPAVARFVELVERESLLGEADRPSKSLERPWRSASRSSTPACSSRSRSCSSRCHSSNPGLSFRLKPARNGPRTRRSADSSVRSVSSARPPGFGRPAASASRRNSRTSTSSRPRGAAKRRRDRSGAGRRRSRCEIRQGVSQVRAGRDSVLLREQQVGQGVAAAGPTRHREVGEERGDFTALRRRWQRRRARASGKPKSRSDNILHDPDGQRRRACATPQDDGSTGYP